MASSLKFVVTKPTERKNPETAMATFGSRVKTHRKKDEVKGYASPFLEKTGGFLLLFESYFRSR